MKDLNIYIIISWRDKDGMKHEVRRLAGSFESASENLGKLERYFQALQIEEKKLK